MKMGTVSEAIIRGLSKDVNVVLSEGIDLEIAKTLYMANTAQYCHQRINIEQERLA